jgi:peptidoglycan glycosyltransferase
MNKDRLKAEGRLNWREYQRSLKKPGSISAVKRWMVIGILVSLAFAGAYKGLVALTAPSAAPHLPSSADAAIQPLLPDRPDNEVLLAKRDVQLLMGKAEAERFLAREVQLPFHSQKIQVVTSIDPELQTYLLNAMDRKNSRYIGIVVMDASSGRILALAGFNKKNPDINPCLVSTYPAASIFKIVTAAAAVDHMGYTADTVLKFNGFKHTLYKRQLTEQTNRYTNTVSFKNSFAQSVNPVFGKIGTLYLKKDILERYAEAFGFNQPIDFELPVTQSRIVIQSKPYHWAEIASGFNNDTTISPVHGAMMASAILNKGRMVAPTIVDRITDAEGNILYRSESSWGGRAMSAKASGVLAALMETTIQSGTGRKSFRDRRRNKILSKLSIGGKTGSIFNRAHDARYDWFVGYARDKKGGNQLAVSVLVAHEEYIGIRATRYARMVMTHYFKNQTARRKSGPIGSKG